MTIEARSSTAPTTARVFHSREASPHPNNPASSVSTFTKTQLRISALTTTVLTAVMFIVSIHGIETAAAVDEQSCAGHVIRRGRTEKNNCIGHGLGRLHEAERDGLLGAATILGLRVPLAFSHADGHDPRRYRIDSYPFGGEFPRHTAHQHFHSALRNRVESDLRPRHVLNPG